MHKINRIYDVKDVSVGVLYNTENHFRVIICSFAIMFF